MQAQHDDRARGIRALLRHAIGRGHVDVPVASGAEPCAGCGEETAVGSVFYSDRRSATRSDGAQAYLCSECLRAAHAARKGQPLTDADLRTIADNGLMVGVGLLGSGGSV